MFPLAAVWISRYTSIKIDDNLNSHEQIKNVAAKLNRANTMFSKIRDFVHKKTLKSIYHAIFESHLFYSCLAWAQNIYSIKRLLLIKDYIYYFTKEIFTANVLFES